MDIIDLIVIILAVPAGLFIIEQVNDFMRKRKWKK
nr:MAG TPA: hypothetical protein [Caudoviricetes sp.]